MIVAYEDGDVTIYVGNFGWGIFAAQRNTARQIEVCSSIAELYDVDGDALSVAIDGTYTRPDAITVAEPAKSTIRETGV